MNNLEQALEESWVLLWATELIGKKQTRIWYNCPNCYTPGFSSPRKAIKLGRADSVIQIIERLYEKE